MADDYEKYLSRRITEEQKDANKFRELFFESDEKRMKLRYDLCLANIQLQQAIVEKEQMKNEKDNFIKILEASSNPMKMTPNHEDKIKNIEEVVTLLKATLEKQEFAFSHKLELLKEQHSTDIKKLYSKIEVIENKSTSDNRTATEAARSDIMELNSKIKGLVTENQALEAKQKAILMEKEVLKRQVSSLQEENRSLNNNLLISKQEIFHISTQLKKCEDNFQSVSANFKQEIDLQKQQYLSEKEMLIDEISRTNLELNDARQQLWKQSNELKKEKEKLEELYISTATHAIEMLSRSKTVENQETSRVKKVKEAINELKQQKRASEEDQDELNKAIKDLEAGLQEEKDKASEKENIECNNKLNDKILWLNENITELDSLKESLLIIKIYFLHALVV